ncbi:phosphoglycerate kinase [Aquimarina agarilytica]|uniref:phosphoglycerate kinase n=1 Tax=Aquimarina agarilytica TaxID=1087449 RepID=UPI0002892DD4|nr:phosphoglycerate kinase [Aquimarina agarilytica]
MKTINDFNFENKKALIRVDFNVPLDANFEVTDATRIEAAKPTIIKILEDGGSAILMSHLGRPKGKQEEFSLKHIVEKVQEILGVQVKMASDCIGADVEAMAAELEPGEILLLENLRYYKEETAGDKDFAEKLSKLGDIYINDAFGTAHRAHASTAIVAEFFEDKGAGYVIEAEIVNAKKVLETGVAPVTAIMGGSKISDKILIVEKLLSIADNIIIGGGMSYTFVKALGGDIGISLCEDDKLDLALELLERAKENNVKMILPLDTVIADDFSNDANIQTVKRGMIPEKWEGLDIGPETRDQFAEIIENSKTVIWNGPMGVAEMENFAHGTIAIAHAVKNATAKGAFSLIGGGDSAAAINNLGFGNDVSYVSTGGGALLEYMEGKVLPGIKAIS